MTTALTAFVYTTALSAGLLLGDTTQHVAVLLVALVLATHFWVRRHQATAVRRAAVRRAAVQAAVPVQVPVQAQLAVPVPGRAPAPLRTTVGGAS